MLPAGMTRHRPPPPPPRISPPGLFPAPAAIRCAGPCTAGAELAWRARGGFPAGARHRISGLSSSAIASKPDSCRGCGHDA